MSDDGLAAWSALVAVYQSVLHDVVQALEEDAGIDSGMFSLLAHLARAQPRGRMPMADLQALMYPRYSQPGLSRLVQRMEGAGLVERLVSTDDARATTIRMTRAGGTRFDRANAVYVAAVRDHFGRHLEPAERTRLAKDLDQVISRRTASEEPPRSRRAGSNRSRG